MKKLLLLTAALLLCSLAHSQGAESSGSYAEVTVVPRLDLNLSSPFNGEASEFTLGNSSLYTLFEGAFSDCLSFTVANHWLCGDADQSWLYSGLTWSDTTNWLDMAYVEFCPGSFIFDLGKMVMYTGGFEYEDWDWDVDWDLSSQLWSNLPCYQWGASAGWTTPSEMTTLSLQMVTSPWGERPFASNLWSYSAQWRGEYGPYSNIWSISAIQFNDMLDPASASFDYVFSLGNQLALGDFTLGLDYTNRSGYDGYMMEGHTLLATLAYAPSERFDCKARYGHERTSGWYGGPSFNIDSWFAGVAAHYYPLRDSQDLKFIASAAYNTLYGGMTATIGVMYYLHLPFNR